MDFALQIVGWAIGLPLEVLLIATLLRGTWKQFPFVFTYLIGLFLSTAIEIPVNIAHYMGDESRVRERSLTYWINEGVLLALIVLLVLGLIWRASSEMRTRRTIRAGMVALVIIGASLSLWAHYSPLGLPGGWMTPWCRDIYFGAAIMDMALWMMLLTAREGNRLVLALSGALGIQFTGEAISAALRQIAIELYRNSSPSNALAVAFGGNVLMMAANLACLYVWWRVLRAETVPIATTAPRAY
jgi:hypothetical protein